MSDVQSARAIGALRAFVRSPREHTIERCELCSAPLDPGRHPHLFEAGARRLACVCHACGACFDGGPEGRRWARVTPRIEAIPDAHLDASTWARSGVPVRLAYFTIASRAGADAEPIAVLPSPAGPIESPLPEGAWGALTSRIAAFGALVPDVEGILAWEPPPPRRGRAYRLSVDHAYRAIGLLRARARGIAPGELAAILEDEILPTLEHGAGGG